MPSTHRLERVNQLIRQELSDLLLRETKDPRLSGYISINSVRTSPDLKYAKVMVSCVCEEKEKKVIIDALTHSAGFFRSIMAKQLKIRRIPELHFVWDASIERGSRVLELIDKVSSEQNPFENNP